MKNFKGAVKNDRNYIKDKALGRFEQKKYEEALKQIELLELQKQALMVLKTKPKDYGYQRIEQRASKSETTALVVLSDTHVDEIVNPSTVQGKNKYNPEIAKKRIEKFFQIIVDRVEKDRQDKRIDNLVLAILGDMISNNIHEELLENTAMRPMEAVRFVQDLLNSGLNFLKNYGGFKKIVVICKDGNHGRLTKKIHISTRTGNSVEWLMYHTLAQSHPDIEWIIEESLLTYYQIYGRKIRFHHGDSIKSGGGVGWIFPPMLRAIHQWDGDEPAYLSISGHFHAYHPGRRFIVNGSVIGYTPFAQAIRASAESPMQAYVLIDSKFGLTSQRPILLGE
jgi:hypothetical protein